VYVKVDTQEMELHVLIMQIPAHRIHVKTVALVQVKMAHIYAIVLELAIVVQSVKLILMNVYQTHV